MGLLFYTVCLAVTLLIALLMTIGVARLHRDRHNQHAGGGHVRQGGHVAELQLVAPAVSESSGPGSRLSGRTVKMSES